MDLNSLSWHVVWGTPLIAHDLLLLRQISSPPKRASWFARSPFAMLTSTTDPEDRPFTISISTFSLRFSSTLGSSWLPVSVSTERWPRSWHQRRLVNQHLRSGCETNRSLDVKKETNGNLMKPPPRPCPNTQFFFGFLQNWILVAPYGNWVVVVGLANKVSFQKLLPSI
jgi:hypothetical protein